MACAVFFAVTFGYGLVYWVAYMHGQMRAFEKVAAKQREESDEPEDDAWLTDADWWKH